VKIFLCRYGSSAAVIAANGVGDARTGFLETDLGKGYLNGIDRKAIQCREVRNIALTEPLAAAVADGTPRVLQATKD